MKSKRAEKYLDRKSPVKTVGDSKFYYPINRLEAEKAVELAEQDAEEEVNHYRKELEESKKREELARKVIDDQREKIEMLKARAAEAFKEYMEQAHGGYLTSDLDNFIQKLNERRPSLPPALFGLRIRRSEIICENGQKTSATILWTLRALKVIIQTHSPILRFSRILLDRPRRKVTRFMWLQEKLSTAAKTSSCSKPWRR